MSNERLSSSMPTSHKIASGEETQSGFSEADIMASETEAPVVPVSPG